MRFASQQNWAANVAGGSPDSCSAAIASLIDHLVGRYEQRRRDLDAERLGALEIDD